MRFFTADLHLGHEKILDKDFSARPFATIKDHDDHIIDRINAHVEPKDELFILGDFCWTGTYRKPGHFRNRIKCRSVHLIWGNHDQASVANQFSTTQDVLIVKLGTDTSKLPEQPSRPIEAFLSHYAHAFWPSSHHGMLHLYGHCHDAREETLDTLFPGRRSIDVGVDTAKRLLGEFRPFSDLWLINHLWSRPGHDQVEWYRAQRASLPSASSICHQTASSRSTHPRSKHVVR